MSLAGLLPEVKREPSGSVSILSPASLALEEVRVKGVQRSLFCSPVVFAPSPVAGKGVGSRVLQGRDRFG